MRIGTIGEKLDLLVRQGATFGNVEATMTNPDGTSVNLTGCVIRGKIRKNALDVDEVCTIDVTISAPLFGKYEFGLSAEKTSQIKAGENITDKESKYVWNLDLEDVLGRVIPLYYGLVTVFREVSHD